jgi:hypothetical protein
MAREMTEEWSRSYNEDRSHRARGNCHPIPIGRNLKILAKKFPLYREDYRTIKQHHVYLEHYVNVRQTSNVHAFNCLFHYQSINSKFHHNRCKIGARRNFSIQTLSLFLKYRKRFFTLFKTVLECIFGCICIIIKQFFAYFSCYL